MGTNADRIAEELTDRTRRVVAPDLSHLRGLSNPGLYAWFVDASGAADLTMGLGALIEPGLIYAGQAGAGTSSATLGSRLRGNHIGGNTRGSTFRFALSCVLETRLAIRSTGGRKIEPAGEHRLTSWMLEHLSVAVASVPDRQALDRLETDVLAALDPPLNLAKMPASDIRGALSALRRRASRTVAEGQPRGVPAQETQAALSRARMRSTQRGLTPEALAADLGLPNAKGVRAFLRDRFPRPPEQLWSRWGPLPADAEAAVRQQFGAGR